MLEYILTFILGSIFIFIGILNTKGNISSLHWYHRHRVLEKDKLVFGKIVGIGTIVIGVAFIIFTTLSIIESVTNIQIYTAIANICLISGFVVGIIMNFYAMLKYNKGIF